MKSLYFHLKRVFTVAKRNRRDRHTRVLSSASDLLSRLPIELISNNILSRLPMEQLLQLRCCNKAFRDLIDDSHFKKFYTDQLIILASHSNITNQVSFLTLIQFNEEKDCRFHFGEYNDISNEYKVTQPITFPPLNLRNKGVFDQIIVGSCNGLVCYIDSHNIEFPPIYVFNPVTRERLNITPLRPVSKSRFASIVNGFGYHPVTKEYKVVRIYHNGQKDVDGEVEVYTLGTGVWRRLGKVLSSFSEFYNFPGVLVNGALHWYDDNCNIASFDLATETFDLVPSPSSLRLEPAFDDGTYDLWAWRESLCIVKHYWRGENLHIWVRNNNDGSWREEFTVPFQGSTLPDLFPNDTIREHDDCNFITRTESGKVLQWYNDKLLSSYDLEKEERRIYGENKPDYYNEIVLHVKSFVSLKDLGEDAEIINYQ